VGDLGDVAADLVLDETDVPDLVQVVDMRIAVLVSL
jgi:hypothetical protein